VKAVFHVKKIQVIYAALVILASTFLQTSYAAEDDLYDFLWLDQDKKVYVLQQKVYQKKHSFYANLGFGFNQTNDFFDSTLFNLTTGFYFNEEWALELNYNTYSNKINDTYKALGYLNGSIPFSRQLLNTYGVMAIWSPFYGKVNTFNKIFYFDWNIGAGISIVNSESNKDTAENNSTADIYTKENYTGFNLKTGLKFHVTKRIHVGADIQILYFQAPGVVKTGVPVTKKWRSNTDVVFSIGMSF
jgi:outer membrane beta-barrel protein